MMIIYIYTESATSFTVSVGLTQARPKKQYQVHLPGYMAGHMASWRFLFKNKEKLPPHTHTE